MGQDKEAHGRNPKRVFKVKDNYKEDDERKHLGARVKSVKERLSFEVDLLAHHGDVPPVRVQSASSSMLSMVLPRARENVVTRGGLNAASASSCLAKISRGVPSIKTCPSLRTSTRWAYSATIHMWCVMKIMVHPCSLRFLIISIMLLCSV